MERALPDCDWWEYLAPSTDIQSSIAAREINSGMSNHGAYRPRRGSMKGGNYIALDRGAFMDKTPPYDVKFDRFSGDGPVKTLMANGKWLVPKGQRVKVSPAPKEYDLSEIKNS